MKQVNQVDISRKEPVNSLFLTALVIGVALMCLKAFVPAASPYMPSSILSALLILIMGGVMLSAGIDKFVNYFITSLLLFLIPILTLISSIVVGDGNSFSNLVALLMLIVWPVFSSFLLEFRQNKKIVRISRFLLLYISVLLIITMITTYKGNLQFPGASRDLAHYETDTSGLLPLYINMNIGGFTFIYTITLVLPLLAYWMKINMINRVIGVATFVIAILCIVSSQYTIALLMSFISVVLAFLPKRLNRRHIISIIVVFLIVLVSGALIGDFFLYLSNTVEGQTMSSRIAEFSQLFSGGGVDTSSDTALRVALISKSWNTFFDNLLLGSRDGLGEHSYLVDNLARFGIFGLIAIIVSFKQLYKKYIAHYKNTEIYYYVIACYMINLVQCYVNTYNGYVCFTLILPLFIVAFQDKINIQSFKG